MSEKSVYALKLIGITGLVYIGFRYLLPLVVPFVFALVLARSLAPAVNWCQSKLHISKKLSAPIFVLLTVAILGAFFFVLIVALTNQVIELITSLPRYQNLWQETVTDFCCRCDGTFGLKDGKSMQFVQLGVEKTTEIVCKQVLPALTGYAGQIVSFIAKTGFSLFIFFLSTIMFLYDKEKIRAGFRRFKLCKQVTPVVHKLKTTGLIYLKAQLIIIFIVSLICVTGIYFVGNRYFLLFGIAIGLFDALPVVGSGSILVPWAVFSLLSGNFVNAAILFSIYLIAMIIREVLEPRLLGNGLGILPVFMLMAIFVGIRLFGVSGILLGPIGYVIIGVLMENRGNKSAVSD